MTTLGLEASRHSAFAGRKRCNSRAPEPPRIRNCGRDALARQLRRRTPVPRLRAHPWREPARLVLKFRATASTLELGKADMP
jgi:hypothetical protein